jgi:hypothetical protein
MRKKNGRTVEENRKMDIFRYLVVKCRVDGMPCGNFKGVMVKKWEMWVVLG